MKRIDCSSVVLFALLFWVSLSSGAAPSLKPNILMMLCDDLGYADLGCQGAPDVKTPRIDSIATNGVRCTAGYVTAPQCSPSRAALLSGRYQQRFGHEGNPNFPLMLMHGCRTIADHLKAAGYTTAHFGKWHLGFASAEDAPKEIRGSKDQMLPTQHGFDESFGFVDYAKAAKNGGDMAPAPRHAYDDRVFARKAADFIARHAAQPWFIYLAFHAPHTQQVDFGGYRKRFPDATEQRVKVLAVMAQLDEAVGVVLDQLRTLHLDESTLVVFLSDNGGTQRNEGETKHFTGSLNTPFSGDKGTTLEGGIREPFLVQWKGRLPAGETYHRPVSSLDILPTALASAGITPPAGLALDGVNLLPFLDGTNTNEPHEALFWRWRAEQAVRMGDWKLVRGKEHRAWRLIDLAHDVKEEHDLIKQHPDKAKALLTRYEQWNATLLPPGPSFKDITEAEDDGVASKNKSK